MFTHDAYNQRRAGLLSQIKSGIILILGTSKVGMNYPSNTYRFHQDSSFLYLFGLDEPDVAGVIDADSGE